MVNAEHSDGSSMSDKGTHPQKRPLARRALRALAGSGAVVAMALVLGFFAYLGEIHGDTPTLQTIAKADGIVVLTGGHNRLEPAAKLLDGKYGKRLLVSGVNTNIGPDTLASALGMNQSLFKCCVDIDHAALDTVGNAREAAAWASRNGYNSLILVTNDYHIPRSFSELRRIAPDLDLQAYPVSNPPRPEETFEHKLDRYRVLTSEYVKYVLSLVRGIAHIG